MRITEASDDRDLIKCAYQAFDAEDWHQAGQLLETVLHRDPDRQGSETLWFDAALTYKFLGDWPKAYSLGKQAAARATVGQQDPAFWNLGIAATVRRDWATARNCWRDYGIAMPDGEGEIVADFGSACVRIETSMGHEVVWVHRLCPTRARILSVPFDASRRFGEVTLHDGAPNAERTYEGNTYPVFDEIMLFEPSELATLAVTVTAPGTEDFDALSAAFTERDLGAENAGSGRPLCACCSESAQTIDRFVSTGRQTMLLAAEQAQARTLLEAWRLERPEHRRWENLHLVRSVR